MCGIAGILSLEGDMIDQSMIEIMAATLSHRGPDKEGFFFERGGNQEWVDWKGRRHIVLLPSPRQQSMKPELAFAHRRLAIIDLSERGHQPMANEDSSLWIVHNGEIYNYIELRKELEKKHQFVSRTDTEVILHAYEEWGIECLNCFNGMWAFSIWDSKKGELFSARDRAGEKPFYYFFDGKRFAFASEIKALLILERIKAIPNEPVIADYLFFGLIDHTQETFFKDIHQLRPGEFLILNGHGMTVQTYWDIESKEVNFKQPREYAERFFDIFEDSIRLRLRSDVPIGTCLSGGLDSSSIVCLANRMMFGSETIDPELVGEKQKTFSSCFENPAYDERTYIEKVIDHTRAEGNYVFPKGGTLFREIEQLIWHQEEPFGSTSIYAQWNVMKRIKERGVIVLLDGQGGDELLAGYPFSFYIYFAHLMKRMHWSQLLKEIGILRQKHQLPSFNFLKSFVSALMPITVKQVVWKTTRLGVEWSKRNFQKRYLKAFPKPTIFKDDVKNYLYQGFRFTSLPGLLHYEDRNSMAFSLEARLPFLDYRLIEYVFSLPNEQKLKEGFSKVVLREAMKGILPEEVRNRTDKMGFVTPEDIWFRTVLRNDVYRIINSQSFAERGYFDVQRVNDAFKNHCRGKINISSIIWRWVNLELWFRTFIDKSISKSQKGCVFLDKNE